MSAQTEYDDLKRRITQMMWEIAPEWCIVELRVTRYDDKGGRIKVVFEMEPDMIDTIAKGFTVPKLEDKS